MQWTSRRERLRAILAGPRCIYPGSVFDPISARLADDIGFEAGMFAGSIASMTVLGSPDLILLTLSEFAAQAFRINRAGELPLIVDADHGYGNALNVMRTVQELEAAGVSALTIEDTDLPPQFGSAGSSRLIPVEEGVGKMRAALQARQDPALAVIGRTSAVKVTGVDDAVQRIKAYEAVGVDAVALIGVTAREQLEACAAAVKLPIMLGGAGQALMDIDYLRGQGVRICLQGHQPFMAAVQAVHDTLKALRQGTAPVDLAGVASGETMKRVTRESDHQIWIKRWLE